MDIAISVHHTTSKFESNHLPLQYYPIPTFHKSDQQQYPTTPSISFDFVNSFFFYKFMFLFFFGKEGKKNGQKNK